MRTLLHLGVKSNQFLKEDVEKALSEMIVNVNTSRCLLALTSSGGLGHASTTVRRITIQQICSAVESSGPKFSRLARDAIERTLAAVAQSLADADPGARCVMMCVMMCVWEGGVWWGGREMRCLCLL